MKYFSLALVILTAVGCTKMGVKEAPKTFKIERRWARSALATEHLGFRHVHRMTPLVAGDLVVQANSLDGIAAFDRHSGHEKWRLKLQGGVEAGVAQSAESIYFGAGDGFFYAVDLLTGKIQWSFPIRSEGNGQPTVDSQRVYFVAGNNAAYALNKKTGKQVWFYNRQDSQSITIRGGSRPTVDGKKVFIGFSDGYVTALNKKTGSVYWERPLNRNKRFRDVDAQPIVDGNRLYVSSYDDGVYCLNKTNGQLIWRLEEGGHSAVTLTPKRLYFSSSKGEVISADKKSGKIIWRNVLKRGIATRPVFYRGLLVYGELSGALKVVSAADGSTVAFYETGRGVTSSPWVDQETGDSYFITANANLYSLKMMWETRVHSWPWEKK